MADHISSVHRAGVGAVYKSLKTHPVRYLLKIPQPSKSLPPTRKQVFQCANQWGISHLNHLVYHMMFDVCVFMYMYLLYGI